MRLTIRQMKGEIPLADPRLLPAGYARSAINCDLDSGTVRPFAAPAAGTPSVWTFVDEAGVDVVPANVSGVNRLLVSNLTDYPEARQGDTTQRWGVVSPATIPTVSTGGSPATGASVEDTVSYRYSLVTSWGEESGLSAASMPVDVLEGEYVILSNFDITAAGNDITHVRVYRTAVSSDGEASYQNVPLRPLADGTAYYDVPVANLDDLSDQVYDVNDAQDGLNDNLGNVQMTDGWDPPPDGVAGGVEYTNGVYALFKNKRVYLSVAGYYYAFPASGLLDYSWEIEYPVMGLGVENQDLVVCTTAFPEIITGTDPATTSRYQLPFQLPCLSKDSIVSTPSGVFYASQHGLARISGGGGEIVTKGLFTSSQWQSLNLSGMICAYFRGRIYAFFSGQNNGLILSLSADDVVWLELAEGTAVSAVFVDEEADALYIKTGSGWQKWNAADDSLEATYISPTISVPPTAFACGQVVASAYNSNLSFQMWGDGSKLCDLAIADDSVFPVPGGSRHREWYVGVKTSGPEVYAFGLAHTPVEMQLYG